MPKRLTGNPPKRWGAQDHDLPAGTPRKRGQVRVRDDLALETQEMLYRGAELGTHVITFRGNHAPDGGGITSRDVIDEFLDYDIFWNFVFPRVAGFTAAQFRRATPKPGTRASRHPRRRARRRRIAVQLARLDMRFDMNKHELARRLDVSPMLIFALIREGHEILGTARGPVATVKT